MLRGFVYHCVRDIRVETAWDSAIYFNVSAVRTCLYATNQTFPSIKIVCLSILVGTNIFHLPQRKSAYKKFIWLAIFLSLHFSGAVFFSSVCLRQFYFYPFFFGRVPFSNPFVPCTVDRRFRSVESRWSLALASYPTTLTSFSFMLIVVVIIIINTIFVCMRIYIPPKTSVLVPPHNPYQYLVIVYSAVYTSIGIRRFEYDLMYFFTRCTMH